MVPPLLEVCLLHAQSVVVPEEADQAINDGSPLFDRRHGEARGTGIVLKQVSQRDGPVPSLLLQKGRVRLPVQPLPLDYPLIVGKSVLLVVDGIELSKVRFALPCMLLQG